MMHFGNGDKPNEIAHVSSCSHLTCMWSIVLRLGKVVSASRNPHSKF